GPPSQACDDLGWRVQRNLAGQSSAFSKRGAPRVTGPAPSRGQLPPPYPRLLAWQLRIWRSLSRRAGEVRMRASFARLRESERVETCCKKSAGRVPDTTGAPLSLFAPRRTRGPAELFLRSGQVPVALEHNVNPRIFQGESAQPEQKLGCLLVVSTRDLKA